ncbi:hypothetical protein AVEN_269526-1, partial [Araneus ventricosus]
DGSD